ncbi:hypothetical protein DJ030_12540 [bacterium endosymbiont of Escarpia laminata]|nr:MAG: hypothetical protein DJ031_12100 [bacterium endosymbiont of Escarpia laminata]RLJ18213.1 MAG: hypothetical protein DJ030_12540 [bacterium endosymbiont of Escarpia laminata]
MVRAFLFKDGVGCGELANRIDQVLILERNSVKVGNTKACVGEVVRLFFLFVMIIGISACSSIKVNKLGHFPQGNKIYIAGAREDIKDSVIQETKSQLGLEVVNNLENSDMVGIYEYYCYFDLIHDTCSGISFNIQGARVGDPILTSALSAWEPASKESQINKLFASIVKKIGKIDSLPRAGDAFEGKIDGFAVLGGNLELNEALRNAMSKKGFSEADDPSLARLVFSYTKEVFKDVGDYYNSIVLLIRDKKRDRFDEIKITENGSGKIQFAGMIGLYPMFTSVNTGHKTISDSVIELIRKIDFDGVKNKEAHSVVNLYSTE